MSMRLFPKIHINIKKLIDAIIWILPIPFSVFIILTSSEILTSLVVLSFYYGLLIAMNFNTVFDLFQK